MSRFIGNIIEEYAFDTFNLVSYKYNGFCDAWLMNIPLEIKGILKNPVDSYGRNKNGRVWITNKNHLQLVKSKGLYLFMIYDYKNDVYEYDIKNYTDIKICYTLFIAAYRINVNNGLNTKISYKKLLELL
jgi:hypothetical protein